MLHKPRGLRPFAWFLTRILRIPLRTVARFKVSNVTVENRTVVPKKGRIIVASNHPSIADPLFLWGALRRNAIALAAAELWRVPGLGLVLRLLGYIPVERGTDAAKLAIEPAVRILEHEGVIIIYPEGKCSDGNVLPFRTGVATLAFATGACVVPVGIRGTNVVKPKGSWRIKLRAPVRLRFGDLLDPADFCGGNAVQEFLDELHSRVVVLSQ